MKIACNIMHLTKRHQRTIFISILKNLSGQANKQFSSINSMKVKINYTHQMKTKSMQKYKKDKTTHLDFIIRHHNKMIQISVILEIPVKIYIHHLI